MKRPDLAGSENLSKVQAPTLLIIGGNDEPVIEMKKDAFKQLTHLQDDEKKKKIIIIPGATHLFEVQMLLSYICGSKSLILKYFVFLF